MPAPDFLRRAEQDGLLLTAGDAYPGFHRLPIYRAYLGGVQTRDLPQDYLTDLPVPSPLALLREPGNPHDRHAVAAYLDDRRLGYLAREDRLLLEKLTRRGLPVACAVIGTQPDAPVERRVSLEIALLYPPHATTDDAIAAAESDRYAGLARVADKPAATRRPSRDPLSAGDVHPGYYLPNFD